MVGGDDQKAARVEAEKRLREELDVQLVACRMSMDLLGFREEEIRDSAQFGGVATYLLDADQAGHNLFI